VKQVAKTVELIRAKGGKVTREPGPVKGGKTVIAFVEDPDGYIFEIIERPGTPEPLSQVMLRVGDLDRAISFYEKVRRCSSSSRLIRSICFVVHKILTSLFSPKPQACGMELLLKRDNPEYKVIRLQKPSIF